MGCGMQKMPTTKIIKFVMSKKVFLLIVFCLYGFWELYQRSNVEINIIGMESLHIKRRDKIALENFFQAADHSVSFCLYVSR
jgi:hypothetical protein